MTAIDGLARASGVASASVASVVKSPAYQCEIHARIVAALAGCHEIEQRNARRVSDAGIARDPDSASRRVGSGASASNRS